MNRLITSNAKQSCVNAIAQSLHPRLINKKWRLHNPTMICMKFNTNHLFREIDSKYPHAHVHVHVTKPINKCKCLHNNGEEVFECFMTFQ